MADKMKNKKLIEPQIKSLGQVFTPDCVVEEMLALRRHKGSALEPACGNGAFLKKLPQAVGIELIGNTH